MVQRVSLVPPRSRLTPLSLDERAANIKMSVFFGHYEKEVDRESAYEKLKHRTAEEQSDETPASVRGGVQSISNPKP